MEVLLEPVLILRDAEQYSPENTRKPLRRWMRFDGILHHEPHWYPMEPYFRKSRIDAGPPICIGGYQAMLSQEQTIANPNVDYICVGDGEYAIGILCSICGDSKTAPQTACGKN